MHRCTLDEARLVDAVLHVIGHGLRGIGEDRRFVHIVPKTCDSVRDELLVERSPPVARDFSREVWKHGWPRPDRANIILAVFFYEVIACLAGVIRCIALVRQVRDVKVRDDDSVKVLCGELVNKPGEVREGLWVYGERTILVLKIYIEPNYIRRDMVCAKTRGYLFHASTWIVGVARLLKAKCPHWRKRCGAGEPRISLNDLLRLRTIEHVVIQRTCRRTEAITVRALVAKVEEGAIGIVKEHADSSATMHLEEERHGLVDGISRFLPAEAIRVPHHEGFTGSIKWTRLVAETEEMIIRSLLFGHAKTRAVMLHWGRIALQHVTREISNG